MLIIEVKEGDRRYVNKNNWEEKMKVERESVGWVVRFGGIPICVSE